MNTQEAKQLELGIRQTLHQKFGPTATIVFVEQETLATRQYFYRVSVSYQFKSPGGMISQTKLFVVDVLQSRRGWKIIVYEPILDTFIPIKS